MTDRRGTQRRRLTVLLGMNVAMIAALVVVGIVSHSLGVLAAGGDYIADSSAILLGIVAVTIRERTGEDSQAPTYVAAINALVLLTVTGFVVVEAVRRLLHGTPAIAGLPVLVTSGLAAVVMVAGVFVLGTDAGKEDLHMRSVLVDTAADALASAATAISGGIIYFTGRYFWLDSALSLAIGALIGVSALKLLASALTALRRGAPLAVSDD
ncbi:MAG: cation diffusion facilitator family transporter [Actinobacteria bacterium]|nr:cation diffusion facilitator family transporter [Actinomycetota bacterium]